LSNASVVLPRLGANASLGDTLFYTLSAELSNDSSAADNQVSGAIPVRSLPQASIVSARGTNRFCADDTLRLSVTSPDSLTTYAWSNGRSRASINYRGASDLRVTVTDTNGCQTDASFAVERLPLPARPRLTLSDTTICQGDSIQVATVDTFDGYRWSTGATEASLLLGDSAQIAVTVTDSQGCSNVSDSITLSVQPLPDARFTFTLKQDTIQVNAFDEDLAEYQWAFGDGSTGSGLSAEHVYGAEDTFQVSLVAGDSLGCTDSTFREAIVEIVGIERVSPGQRVAVYPNPFDASLNIAFELDRPQRVTITLFDLQGRVVQSQWLEGRYGTGAHREALGGLRLKPGSYILDVRIGDRRERFPLQKR
jgi:hypothetical protein